MFCSECGKTIADNSKFCPECGKEIDTFDSDDTDTDQGQVGFYLFWIILISIIGIGTFFYFFRESAEDKAWKEDYRAIFIEECLDDVGTMNENITACKCAADKVIKNNSTSDLKDDLEDKEISFSLKANAFNESYPNIVRSDGMPDPHMRYLTEECKLFRE